MRSFLAILCVLTIYSLSAQQGADSVRRGLYVHIDVGVQLDYRSPYIDSKYFDRDVYTIQWAPFEIRTPNTGLGFYSKRKRTFFRTDISYWYGRKDASTKDYVHSTTIEGKSGHITGPPSTEPGVEYRYEEVSTGKVNLHFLDWNLCLGINLGKRVSLIGGFRKSFLFEHSYTGTLDRNGAKYFTNGWYGPTIKADTAYVHYEGKEMRDTEFQVLNGVFFYNVGVAYSYRIGKHHCFSEINFNLPPKFSLDRNYAYIAGKFAFELCGRTNKVRHWKPKNFEGVKVY